MKMLDVYPVFDIEPVKAMGSYIWDEKGNRYLDFYGGHAVISIGLTHPHYVTRIQDQLNQLSFYSNSVKIAIQEECAAKLGALSGYPDYDLFMCNSGAEALENAMKLAAFNCEGDKVIVFEKGFHGRTSMAVSATDNPKIQTKFDNKTAMVRLPLNDLEALETAMDSSVCAVIVEGILGIGGIHEPSTAFFHEVRKRCDQFGAALILDEVQSGFGRSGHFFAHQKARVKADIVAMAKGMGNGFPVGGVLVSPELETWKGMLGSTFGGNHLACAATLGVLEVIEQQELMKNATQRGEQLIRYFEGWDQVKEIRGSGLMLGLVFDFPVAPMRKSLVYDQKVFTGSSSEPNTLRLLPPLTIGDEEIEEFVRACEAVFANSELMEA